MGGGAGGGPRRCAGGSGAVTRRAQRASKVAPRGAAGDRGGGCRPRGADAARRSARVQPAVHRGWGRDARRGAGRPAPCGPGGRASPRPGDHPLPRGGPQRRLPLARRRGPGGAAAARCRLLRRAHHVQRVRYRRAPRRVRGGGGGGHDHRQLRHRHGARGSQLGGVLQRRRARDRRRELDHDLVERRPSGAERLLRLAACAARSSRAIRGQALGGGQRGLQRLERPLLGGTVRRAVHDLLRGDEGRGPRRAGGGSGLRPGGRGVARR